MMAMVVVGPLLATALTLKPVLLFIFNIINCPNVTCLIIEAAPALIFDNGEILGAITL